MSANKNAVPEIEAQLTYATALMAGCMYLFYQLLNFNCRTGWDGIFSLLLSCFAMLILELVICGMALHIFWRGHWMALSMLSRHRHIVSEDKLVALDGLAVGAFYDTFRYLHMLLRYLLLFLALRLSYTSSGWIAHPAAVVFIYLVSGPVLWACGEILFFWPRVRRTAQRWLQLRDLLFYFPGSEAFSGDSAKKSPGRLRICVYLLLMVVVMYINILFSVSVELKSDKAVYIAGLDRKIMLTFRHGGVRNGYFIDKDFELYVSTLNHKAGKPRWYPAGDNAHLCVLRISDLKPGPCSVRLIFRGYTMKNGESQSSLVLKADTRFLVAK